MRNLSQPKILSAPIPLPPFDEQTALTTAFQHLEATIRVCTAECGRAEAAVDALDQALLAKAFRGELVPQDPADEPASVLLDRLRASRPA